MAYSWSDHSHLWQLSSLILGAIVLGACGSPAASTPLPLPANPTATTAPATTTPEPTLQTPPPAIDNVIPKPASVVATGGTFRLTASTGIYVEPATDEVMAIGQYLADHINPASGYALKVQAANGAPAKGISLSLSAADPALGPEGYQLTITPELVRLTANQPAGLFYGVQTIRQLLPPAIDSSSVQPGPWVMGTGTISDSPRFAWRGAMLDVARHFFSVADVTRYIDLLAYYKINRLHLHLSDDQGWRIQIKAWPNLTVYGSSLEVGGTPGGFYSQEDYSAIVNYARSRYITIIPEIDMPGHSNAALSAYPELNCSGVAPAPYTGIEVGFSSFCTGRAITYKFLDDVIGELAALTPGPYIHIGGDEAISTPDSDYISFIEKVQDIVKAHCKQVIGWEEISKVHLLTTSVAQAWKSEMAVQAAQQGCRVIFSPANRTYLDMQYDPATPFGLHWAGYVGVEDAYQWDPTTTLGGIPPALTLGIEAPLWSETLRTIQDIEYMAFPRLPGLAELGWSPQAGRSWTEYRQRLGAHGARLTAMGVNFYPSPEIDFKLITWR